MYNERPKVLIVDDDAQVLETLSLYLEEVADVVTALGGKQAIEYIRQNQVDVVFLDVNMPIMNGYTVLEQFRNMKECINVPVVFVTGQNDKNTILNSAAMGSDGILVKPITKETLQKKTMEMFEKTKVQKNQKTILAIDDDIAYLRTIDSYLRDRFNVVIINSAKLAFDYLMKNTPDLILLDYQMPLYNGASLMNMVSKKDDKQSIPVIIISGAMDKEALKECYACNPNAYLAKPVSKEVLLENIQRVLAE